MNMNMKADKNKSIEQEKSIGKEISDWQRQRANAYTDEKREELLNRGLAKIYGASKPTKTAIHRA
jgi:hypothetical protein